jgi:SAM-dependent methyltransferase
MRRAGSPWNAPETVAGFAQAAPNPVLMRFADELREAGFARALDIGCGAGRNAVPLARSGWIVFGIDDSQPMLQAAAVRACAEQLDRRLALTRAAMDALPVRAGSMDLIIAHGIWNLARSSDEFRRGVTEAARVTRPGARLFLFTFSRNTLPPSAHPVTGESFVFTQFSGEPQCFLTAEQLVEELGTAGFTLDPAVPLRELNRQAGLLQPGSVPVIYEAGFRRQA